MFPDSKIAKKVSIAAERKRTSPCILNKALASPVVEGICMWLYEGLAVFTC